MDLGNDPGTEAEARSCSERVASVAAPLHLEGEAADLIVGVGEGRHRGQVVDGDAAAPELQQHNANGRGAAGGAQTETEKEEAEPSLIGRKGSRHRTTTGLGVPEEAEAVAMAAMVWRLRRCGRGSGITLLPA